MGTIPSHMLPARFKAAKRPAKALPMDPELTHYLQPVPRLEEKVCQTFLGIGHSFKNAQAFLSDSPTPSDL